MCKKEKAEKGEEDGKMLRATGERERGGVKWGHLDGPHPSGDTQPETKREKGMIKQISVGKNVPCKLCRGPI